MESNVGQLPIHDRLLAWFEIRKRQVLWSAGGVVVAGLAAGFFIWHQNDRETRANEALSRKTNRRSDNAEPSETPGALVKVAAEYPNTDAGGRALLLAGADFFAQGKYPEARAQFEKYLRQYRDTPFVGQALLGVAVCLETQGKTNEAVAAYTDVVQHHPAENIAPQAKFGLARLCEAQNRLEQARDFYLELVRSGAYGTISTEAGLRLGDLIAQHPNLAPAKPAFPAAPEAGPRKP